MTKVTIPKDAHELANTPRHAKRGWGGSRSLTLSAIISAMLATVPGARICAETAREISLPAGDLLAALDTLAKASDVQLIYRRDQLKGVRTQGVRGVFITQDAVRKLLEGTPLRLSTDAATGAMLIAPQADTPALSTSSLGYPKDAGVASVPIRLAGNSTESTTPNRNRSASPTPSGNAIAGRALESAGTPVAGALVRIIETGQVATTDDRGAFRIVNLPTGEYTLSISYLGYQPKTWHVVTSAGDAPGDYILDQLVSVLDEVTVYGTRSARAKALNQQRTATNNTEVVSADQLGNFTGTTLSEALRHVSGVGFQRDNMTGEGTNIIIRGLEPNFNTIKLNGLTLPAGNGSDRDSRSLDRAPNLSNFLADSVARITIHKSLLPSHDSTGTGGLVEIETLTPMQRSPRYANFSTEGGRRGKDFSDEVLMSGTLSGIFGEDRPFGLSASAQYRDHRTKSISYSSDLLFGQYLPAGITNPFEIAGDDPTRNAPYESTAGAGDVYSSSVSLNADDTRTTTLAVTLAGEWQPFSNTHLTLDIQRAKGTLENFSASAGTTMGGFDRYRLRPVAALGGEERYALTYDNLDDDPSDRVGSIFQSYGFLTGGSNTTDTYSLRGVTTAGRWELDYTAGFARGTSRGGRDRNIGFRLQAQPGDFQVAFDPAFISSNAVDPAEGVIVSPFGRREGDRLPLPMFTPEGWAFVNDSANYYFSNGARTLAEEVGRNDRRTAELNAKYHADFGVLTVVQGGLQYEAAHFRSSISNRSSLGIADVSPNVSQLGLTFGRTELTRIGSDRGAGFNYLRESGVKSLFDNLAQYMDGPSPLIRESVSLPNPQYNQQYTDEDNLAAYLQAELNVGKLQVVAGARVNRVDVNAMTLRSPVLFLPGEGFTDPDPVFAQTYSRLLADQVVQTEVLPRAVANYRLNERLIFRGSYALSQARPSLGDLNAGQFLELGLNTAYGPNGNQQGLAISRGNPDLKPATTHNFDLSAEYYSREIGVLKLSVFYKHIKNLLEQNRTLGLTLDSLADTGVDFSEYLDYADTIGETNPALSQAIVAALTPPGNANLYITSTLPRNNPDDARLWGADFSVERQFTFLPGRWSGLGIFANAVYADSAATRVHEYFSNNETRSVRFSGQQFASSPELSGTFSLTYNRAGLDGALTYGYQDRYLLAFMPNNLDTYTESVETLDLRTSYFFNWKRAQLIASFEVRDMLRSPSDPDTSLTVGGSGGLPVHYFGARYLGGREFRLGFSATF